MVTVSWLFLNFAVLVPVLAGHGDRLEFSPTKSVALLECGSFFNTENIRDTKGRRDSAAASLLRFCALCVEGDFAFGAPAERTWGTELFEALDSVVFCVLGGLGFA